MDRAITRVTELLHRCGTPSGVLPATALYSEGWMLRLVLDAYSRLTNPRLPLKAAANARWLSEVLLPSRFLARSRADELAEGWTHADGAVGHFSLRSGGRGDIALARDATQFVVTEAKMFSPLSAGTRRAPGFNQAARNIACMAHLITNAHVPFSQFDTLAFVVLAPRSQLTLTDFADLIHRDAIARTVAERVRAYNGLHDDWHTTSFMPIAERIDILPIAWEDALAEITTEEREYGNELTSFYQACVRFNQPMPARSST